MLGWWLWVTAVGRTQDAPSHSLIETDSRLIIIQYTATENSGASTSHNRDTTLYTAYIRYCPPQPPSPAAPCLDFFMNKPLPWWMRSSWGSGNTTIDTRIRGQVQATDSEDPCPRVHSVVPAQCQHARSLTPATCSCHGETWQTLAADSADCKIWKSAPCIHTFCGFHITGIGL